MVCVVTVGASVSTNVGLIVSVATGILVGGDDTGTGFKVGGIVGSCVGCKKRSREREKEVDEWVSTDDAILGISWRTHHIPLTWAIKLLGLNLNQGLSSG